MDNEKDNKKINNKKRKKKKQKEEFFFVIATNVLDLTIEDCMYLYKRRWI